MKSPWSLPILVLIAVLGVVLVGTIVTLAVS